MMSWDEGLSERQIMSVLHVGSHARLLAGPGTGKTLTLTRRLIKLITEDGTDPEQILAVAFTRINAHNLRSNVASGLAQYDVTVPNISTLHSFALRQLLRNSSLITSLPQPLRIADDYEETNIIHYDIARLLDLKKKSVEDLFISLSSDWQSLAVEDPEYQPPDPRFTGAWQQHRQVYGYTLRSELVWQLKHSVEENPDGITLLPVRYLLIDEYQDLNKCDLALVKIISDRGAEIFCVGDDDQSIYGFRRAHPMGIRRFLDEFQPSTPLALDICWRCDRRIIDVGQYVANLDPSRLEKPLKPRVGAGEGQVHLLRFTNQFLEAAGVANICHYLIESEKLAPEDILILVRSDDQGRYSSVLKNALQKAGLEVNVKVEKGGPLEELSGRYLLSVLRIAVNCEDDLAWRTILQYARRQNSIGSKTIIGLYNYAIENGLRFHQVIDKLEEEPELLPRGNLIQQEMIEIKKLTEPLSDFVARGSCNEEYGERLKSDKSELLEQVRYLAEIIIPSEAEREILMDHILKTMNRSESTSLQQLVNALTGPEDTPEQELEPGRINILSMHRAKGLSAKAVVIVAAEEQLIPGRAVGERTNDERRLLYVSITRAKNYLFITYCNSRIGQQSYSGSDSGNPRRNLTPFLRGALSIKNGWKYTDNLMQAT